MEQELAALAADVIAKAREPWEYLLLRATVRGGVTSHRVTSGSSEEHVRCHHPLALRAIGQDMVMEMRIERDGTFEALVTDGIKQFTGYLPPSFTVVREPRPRYLYEPYERTDVVSDGPLAHVEAEIGALIPAEVHDLYRRGTTDFGDGTLIPADEILAVRRKWLGLEHRASENPRTWAALGAPMMDGRPGALQRVGFHPLWVPIGLKPDGYYVRCVDLAPGPTGHVGQLIEPFGHLADSVTEWLEDPISPEWLSYPERWDAVRDGIKWFREDAVTLELTNAGDLDLARLELPHLRNFTVHGERVRVDDRPLEYLEIRADEIELGALDELLYLKVSGAHVELPSLPKLRVLDVSGADVDIESLPEVEYLVLNAEQWQRCSSTPAAARMTGESSLARALDWAGERGVELPRQVISGSA